MSQEEINSIYIGDPLPEVMTAIGKAALGAYRTVGLVVRLPVNDGFAKVLFYSDRTRMLEFMSMDGNDYELPSSDVQDNGGVWIILNTPMDFSMGSDHLTDMLYLALYILEQNKERMEPLTHPDLHISVFPEEKASSSSLQVKRCRLPTVYSWDRLLHNKRPGRAFEGAGRKKPSSDDEEEG